MYLTVLTVPLCAGKGVDKDVSEAVRWYARAARQNDTSAQFNLAVCFQEGTGVPKDLNKAAKWYWRAANLGDTQAMYNLGVCYTGVLVNRLYNL